MANIEDAEIYINVSGFDDLINCFDNLKVKNILEKCGKIRELIEQSDYCVYVFEDKFTTESKGAVIGSIFDPPFVSKYMVG